MNQLWFGDCLTVMRDKMNLGSVDLIYLDPPFNSNRDYNAIYKDETGRPLPDQVRAFRDMWQLDSRREQAIRYMPVLMREQGIDDKVAEFWRIWMNALRGTNEQLLAYLSYMVERLLYMKPILKPTGSIYLHCDPTASHYIKVMMDAIFGHDNFRNEIVWSYRRWPSKSRNFQTMHDVILFYSNGRRNTFNVDYEPPSESYLKRFKGQTQVLDPERKTRKLIIDKPTKGMPHRDVWDISILAGSSKERLGYATQKPLALLERVIKASSNEGDMVLDPFCGCATTLEAAHKLNRRWFGIDAAIHAVKRVGAKRLEDRLGLVRDQDFIIRGIPSTLEGAKDLWEHDRHQFQCWAMEEADGFPTTRKTGDGGIDGRLFFPVPNEKALRSMTIEVKGGKNVGIDVVRGLRGVLERDENALMAGLIIMEPLGERKTRNFLKEMAQAGDIDVYGMPFPRMQLRTVQELLDGKAFHAPGAVGRGTGQGVLISP